MLDRTEYRSSAPTFGIAFSGLAKVQASRNQSRQVGLSEEKSSMPTPTPSLKRQRVPQEKEVISCAKKQKTSKEPAANVSYIGAAVKRLAEENASYNNDRQNPVYRRTMDRIWVESMKMENTFDYCTTTPDFEDDDDDAEQTHSNGNEQHPYPFPKIFLKELHVVMARDILANFSSDCEEFLGKEEGQIMIRNLLKLREEDVEWIYYETEDEEYSESDEDGTREVSQQDYEKAKQFLGERGLPYERLLGRYVCEVTTPIPSPQLRALDSPSSDTNDLKKSVMKAQYEKDEEDDVASDLFGNDGTIEGKSGRSRILVIDHRHCKGRHDVV